MKRALSVILTILMLTCAVLPVMPTWGTTDSDATLALLPAAALGIKRKRD